jgi:hypothetical protein
MVIVEKGDSAISALSLRVSRLEFREDVGGLTPFSFGRPWTGETVKTRAVLSA